MIRKWLVLGAVCAAAACSGTSDNGGTDAGAADTGTTTQGNPDASSGGMDASSSGTDGGSDAGTGGAQALCTNPPANNAMQIADQFSTATMPPSGTATGGTIPSGTYYMSQITNFEKSASTGSHKDTLVINTADSTFVVNEVNGGQQKPIIAGTYVATGHTMNQSLVCPAMVSASVEYTVSTGSPQTLTFYDYSSKSVSIWTKQ